MWVSYKTNALLNVLSWVLPVFTYFFVGTSLGEKVVSATGVANYTSFFVIGLAFQGYVSSAIGTISQRLRNEQLYGTLEYYVLSPTGAFGFLSYSALWGFTLNTLNALIILGVGSALGVTYSTQGVAAALVIILMLLVSTFGIAMLSGAFVLVTKQGNPVAFFFTTFTALISGTVFPVASLPLLVRYVSYAIPLTWALNGLRLSLLQGYSLSKVAPIIGILGVFDIITVPLGLLVYKLSYDYVRRKGTLSQY